MRWVLPFFVVMIGCVATIPSDPTISADLACETARAIVQLRAAPDAKPEDDKPKPGDKCQPCNGTGKLPTDGRVVVQCGACGGTGRVR
jgi:hypothetical protein